MLNLRLFAKRGDPVEIRVLCDQCDSSHYITIRPTPISMDFNCPTLMLDESLNSTDQLSLLPNTET